MARINPFKIQESAMPGARIKNFIRDRYSGDYFEFSENHRSQSIGKHISERKILSLFLIFCFFILVLFGRALYLQIVKGDYYRHLAEGNRIRSDVIKANRGLIYDRFGNLLVKNISYFFLYISPALLPEDSGVRQSLLQEISILIDLDPAELDKRLNSKLEGDKALVYENVPYESAIKLMLMSENNPSLSVNFEPRRQYFANLNLSHVLGYLGVISEADLSAGYAYHDRVGKDGLELIYEDTLRGQDGARSVEVDALFKEKNIISETVPTDGQDLNLTIDATAQGKLAEIMQTNAKNNDKNKMAAIVLDPSDGGILAIASLPTYDNNIFTSVLNTEDYKNIIQDPNTPLLNRVISGTYPLGSVFKTVMASAALEEKIIDTSFRVQSTGGVQLGNSFFPDWRSGGHGSTDIYWALADSVNTFFYTVGGGNNQWLTTGLGIDKITDYASRFGLGKISGIDLPSEATGFLPSQAWKQEIFGEKWYVGDTYNLSIGQGFLTATPLQAAIIMSCIANSGTAYVPHLAKDIDPKIALTNIVSSANLDVVRTALRQTVTRGTAQSMQSVSVPVAGKTGTAQFNNQKQPHSWFAGFAPYDDPKIVIAVLVEEGGDRGLAVTVARQFMEWYFSQ